MVRNHYGDNDIQLSQAPCEFYLGAVACILAVASWWADLVTREVMGLACLYVVPSTLVVTAAIRLFARIAQVRFRRLMFALLFALSLAMCVGEVLLRSVSRHGTLPW